MIRPRLGVVIPYVAFYEKIAPIREERLQFAEQLIERLSAEFDVTGCVVETEESAERFGRVLRNASVDGVIVAPAVAAFGALGWATLAEVPAPVCIWCVQPDATVPEDYNLRTLIRNSGSLAVQALANTLARHDRQFRVLWTAERHGIPEALRTWAAAAAVASRLTSARFGIVGSVFPQMTDVAFDGSAWPGEEIVHVSSSDLTQRFLGQAEERVAERTADMRNRHRIHDLQEDILARSARLSLALDEIVTEHGLDAGAFNCHGSNCLANEEIGITACYAVSRQTSSGCPFSCTGDLPTALAMWILSRLSDAVVYAEMDMVDPKANVVLLANGGEGNSHASANGEIDLTPNANFEGVRGRGASLHFEPFCGAATILSFTPVAGNRYRCIAAEGELIAMSLPDFPLFHAGFRFRGINAVTGFQRWCEAGAIHHLAVAPGHWCAVLKEMAHMRNYEWYSIGGE